MNETFYINEFITITVDNNEFFFGIPLGESNRHYNFRFEYNQKKVMLELIQGKGYSQEYLIEIYSKDIIDYFIKEKIIVNYVQDIESLMSRTNAYFEMNLNKLALDKLRKSTVLILGCGGIGTHVAWNLAAMGIGELILLDYDVVEISNLNRQLLFDIKDLGKLKVEVLKEKLEQINPMVHITIFNKRIMSEVDLEEIVMNNPCDLIIKSLDSPMKFPEWLDNVSAKYNTNYIAGTTSGVFSLIGPTYIPGYSHRYSDFFEHINEYDLVSGIAPSISVQQYQCASEISIEAFKLLIKLDRQVLKYTDRIHYIDNIHNIEMDMLPRNALIEADVEKKNGINKNILLISMILLLIMQITGLYQLLWIGVIFLTFIPSLLFTTSKYAGRATFTNLSLYVVVGIIVVIIGNKLLNSSMEIYSVISSIMVLFVVYSLIVLMGTVASSIFCSLKIKAIRRMTNDRI